MIEEIEMTNVGTTGALVLALLLSAAPVAADHECTSPLVLDLDGDGRILTTGWEYGVEFDINGDGTPESIGWLAKDSGDGFLWIDLNLNGTVDDGGELFGSSTLLPDGEFAEHGFQALAVYDAPEFGGDGDGVISKRDLIWQRLRIWVDQNSDGVSQPRESRPLGAHGVVAIGLEHRTLDRLDGHLNLHALVGSTVLRSRRPGRERLDEGLVEDIFFASGAGPGVR